jgi:intracellular septation protein A
MTLAFIDIFMISMSNKKENPWLNLLINIAIPVMFLTKGEAWFGLSPLKALCIALGFPIAYGLYDLIVLKKYNTLSIIGLVSLLLTGGIGLLEMPTHWIAWKEATIPAVIAIVTVLSLWTRYPLVKTFLYRDEILNIKKIETQLDSISDGKARLDQLLRMATWGLFCSFMISAVLNYVLAKWIVKSPAGTQAFTEELGKMAAWSYPVIVLPSMAILMISLWMLIRGLERLTGLKLEDILQGAKNS